MQSVCSGGQGPPLVWANAVNRVLDGLGGVLGGDVRVYVPTRTGTLYLAMVLDE